MNVNNMTPEQTQTAICCKVIQHSYELGLPKSYPHDVAHTCMKIMTLTPIAPFVVTFRDCGVEFSGEEVKFRMICRVFGDHWQHFRYEVNAYEQRVDAIPLTADEVGAYLRQSFVRAYA